MGRKVVDPAIVEKCRSTEFGFEWGPAKVERHISDKKEGWIIVGITTPKQEIQVYVTKTGKIRVHDRHGEWLPKGRKHEPSQA